MVALLINAAKYRGIPQLKTLLANAMKDLAGKYNANIVQHVSIFLSLIQNGTLTSQKKLETTLNYLNRVRNASDPTRALYDALIAKKDLTKDIEICKTSYNDCLKMLDCAQVILKLAEYLLQRKRQLSILASRLFSQEQENNNSVNSIASCDKAIEILQNTPVKKLMKYISPEKITVLAKQEKLDPKEALGLFQQILNFVQNSLANTSDVAENTESISRIEQHDVGQSLPSSRP